MTTLPPIALIVFSNDLDSFLPNIEKERNLIEEALQHYDDSNRLKVIARTGVTIEDLFKLFNRYKGRVALFHFAGHAHGKGLQLAENANAQGLTDLFRREATEGQLRFVFLNGCSTKAQVTALRAAGVSSVIATNCPINDNKALEFSQQFYRSLSNADQIAHFDYPTTLQKAFETAKSFFNTKYNNLEANTRGFLFKTAQTSFEWELDTNFLDWTLPNKIIYPSIDFQAGTKWVESLRQTLTKQRIKVGNFPLAVFACYGSLVEVYLQKMETEVSKQKPLMRLGFLADAFQSSLRYLCYIQLAQLLKMENPPKRLELQDFFEMKTEDQKRFDYLNLLEITTNLLPKETAFMPEIDELLEELGEAEGELQAALSLLQQYHQRLLKNDIPTENIEDICEIYLSALVLWLRRIAFLAKYRLVSIKDILVQYRLGITKQFAHLYGELHGIYEASTDFDYTTYTTEDYFTYNHSVLLFNENVVENAFESLEQEKTPYLSLSPLVIDQSVFVKQVRETPEIFYFTGKKSRYYCFSFYRNETFGDNQRANKMLEIRAENTDQPKFNELYEQVETLFKPFKNAK